MFNPAPNSFHAFQPFGSQGLSREAPSLPVNLETDARFTGYSRFDGPIIGFCFKNGVLIAAKSSITRDGLVVSRSCNKIKRFENVLFCGTGNAADIDYISDQVLARLRLYRIENRSSPSTKTVAQLIVNALRGTKLDCDFIVAGMDSGPHSGSQLYQIAGKSFQLFFMLLKEKSLHLLELLPY